jgi:TolB-like protein
LLCYNVYKSFSVGTGEMFELRILLFGQLRLEVDGVPHKIKRRKVAALLAYLAMASRPHSRDELAELLYPRMGRDRAYAGLRQSLSYLKSEIGDGVLKTASQSVSLVSGRGFFLDVSEFRNYISLARGTQELDHLRAAVELYSGPFLESFFLPDSPNFEEWQIEMARNLSYEYCSALIRLNDLYLQQGSFDEAVRCARSIVALDRLDETAQRRLIRTFVAAGKKRDAIRQFERFRGLLNRELNAEPEEETRKLLREIHSTSAGPKTGSPVQELRGKRITLGVLPFENLSNDDEQMYFCDGLTEDLTTALTRIPGLKIAACSTMFGFKGTSPDVRRLGRDLDVNHVIEGTIQKGGSRVRVNVQLIETEEGNHIWAQKFDKELSGIFEIQDDIVQNVVTELDVQLSSGEQARMWRASTKSSEAYDLYLRARYTAVSPEGFRQDLALLDQALALDPTFVAALCYKGIICLLQAQLVWVSDPQGAFEEARRLFKTALQLDDHCADAHGGRGMILFVEQKYKEAEKEYELALSLGPDMEYTHLICAAFYTWKKDYLKALSIVRRTKDLCPYPHSQAYAWEIVCLRNLHRLEEALAVSKHALELFPDGLDILVNHANVCRLLNLNKERDIALKKILDMKPDFSIESWVRGTGIYNERELAQYIAELHEAGFP